LLFKTDGVELFKVCASSQLIEELKLSFDKLDFRSGSRTFDVSQFADQLFGQRGCFTPVLAGLELPKARPVRVLAFDKTPLSNWNLGWHQDRVVALKERQDVPGFVNWTIKSGVHHAQAPMELLEKMFSLRLHLDDCPKENGALRVVPGSARFGKIDEAGINSLVAQSAEFVCEAMVGDVLAMKALTLHASSPSTRPSHRRVLHVDFCYAALPSRLEWAHVQ
jgi:hypothetical protein